MLGTDWGGNRLGACLMGLMKKEKHTLKKGKSRRTGHREKKRWLILLEQKRKTIRKEKESQDSSDRDGRGTWNYLGFSEGQRKSSTECQSEGIHCWGRDQERSEKEKATRGQRENNPRRVKSRHGRRREQTVGGEIKTRGCGIKAAMLRGLRHERCQVRIQNENRSSE